MVDVLDEEMVDNMAVDIEYDSVVKSAPHAHKQNCNYLLFALNRRNYSWEVGFEKYYVFSHGHEINFQTILTNI